MAILLEHVLRWKNLLNSFFQEEKLSFFLVLERDLGVDHEEVIRATGNLVNAQVS